MIYESGTATTPHNLLSLLNDFLSANGWAVDEFAEIDPADTDRGARLAVNNGALHFGFRSFTGTDPSREDSSVAYNDTSGNPINGLALIGFSSFNANVELDQQSGKGQDLAFMELNSDFCEKYHFFTDLDSAFICVVAEYSSGFFSAVFAGTTTLGRQFYSGTSDRSSKNIGSNTRPPFWLGSGQTNHIRGVNGSFITSFNNLRNSTGDEYRSNYGVPNFISASSSTGASMMSMTAATEYTGNFFVNCYQFELDERRAVLPAGTSDSDIFRFIGSIPNVLFCSTRTIAPNEEFSFGSETYINFPIYQKSDPHNPKNKQLATGFLVRKS